MPWKVYYRAWGLFFPPPPSPPALSAAWLSPRQVEASLGTYRILVEKGAWRENGGNRMGQRGGKMPVPLSLRAWQHRGRICCLLRLPLHKDALLFFISLMLLNSSVGLYKPRLEQIRKWSSELFSGGGGMWLGLLNKAMAPNGAACPLGFISKSICSA